MGGGHGPWGVRGGGEGHSVDAGPAVAWDFCCPSSPSVPASAFPVGGTRSSFAVQPLAFREWLPGRTSVCGSGTPGHACRCPCLGDALASWTAGLSQCSPWPSETCGWKAALRSRSCCHWSCGGNQWMGFDSGAGPPPNPALQAAWPAALLPSLPAPSPRGLRPAFPFSPQAQRLHQPQCGWELRGGVAGWRRCPGCGCGALALVRPLASRRDGCVPFLGCAADGTASMAAGLCRGRW